ncbi:MAG: flagellar hook-basal body complex protein, partial [Rhodobacteraceae bacterium]|nr:flagellar hook-basal body complex protein [Paracoccaceae bacterium]
TPTIPATGESNTWTMEITDSAAAGATIGEYTLVFEDSPTAGGTLASVAPVSGGAYDPVTGQISLALNGTTVALDIGTLNSFSGMSQLSDVFAPNSITKNGSPPGVLTTVEVDANGYVHAYFDTGLSQVIYQIPLVDVPNPNGLKINDDQSYAISADSGDFFLWDAGDGPTGEVVGYAQEQSRTDVAHELTTLIQTQRAYSSNAKVIQTVDEMLQETTNIKR